MKTLTIKAIPLLLLFAFSPTLFAGNASIMGQVTDPQTKQPIADASVVFDCQGNQKQFFTNEHGYYYASNIPSGTYIIIVSYLSNTTKMENVKIADDEVRQIDIPLNNSIQHEDVVINVERDPIIKPFEPDILTMPKEEIRKLAITRVDEIIDNIGGGVVDIEGTAYVRGARGGDLSYYIDGGRVIGNPNIPLCGLETYRPYLGFIPPKYGDTDAGVVVMETRSFFSEKRDR